MKTVPFRRQHGMGGYVPGNTFDPGGDGFVRCRYATAYEQIEEAMHRLERFVSRHG